MVYTAGAYDFIYITKYRLKIDFDLKNNPLVIIFGIIHHSNLHYTIQTNSVGGKPRKDYDISVKSLL